MTALCLVTARTLPGFRQDDRPLIEALAERGLPVEAAAWDDPRVDWRRYDALLLRSCWNVQWHGTAFLDWLDVVDVLGVRVLNDTRLVRWNLHKGYLLELARRGTSVVPTLLLRAGEACNLADLMREHGWSSAVIKPAVSLSAHATVRIEADRPERGQRLLEELLRDGDALLQPFVSEILTGGEWSLMFVDASYSHAVVKRPADGDFRVQSEHGGTAQPVEPAAAWIEAGAAALACAPHRGPYARVDGIVRERRFELMELEAIDPELFLQLGPPQAARQLAEAIAVRIGSSAET